MMRRSENAETKLTGSLFTQLERLGGFLPFLIAFFVVPFSVYLPNQGHFDYSIIVLAPMLLGGFACLVVVYLIGISRKPAAQIICKWLFWIGVFLLINDLVIPVGIGKLDGRNIAKNIRIQDIYIYVQTAVLILCLLAGWFIKWSKIKVIAGTFVAVMLLLQMTTFAIEISPETIWSLSPGTEPVKTNAPPNNRSTKSNVYHIILDGFSSQSFLKMMSEGRLQGLFDGFTFYKNARSNGLITNQSVPGILTGTFWPEKRKDQTIRQWWYETVSDWSVVCKEKGLLNKAYEDGFSVSQYIPRSYMWPYERAARLYLGSQLTKEGGLVPSFADLWLLRLAPVPVKKMLFDENDKGPFSRAFGVKIHYRYWAHWSVGLSKILLEDEKSRNATGNYIFAHLMLPHYPYVVNSQCDYIGAQKLTEENYFGQISCALKIIKALFAELKKQGKYKDSLIVVHSDHGEHAVGPVEPFNQMPKDLLDDFGEEKYRREFAKYISHRSLALLLIKLPGAAEKPLQVDNRVVPLVDLEPTICDVLGWAKTSRYGTSLLRKLDQHRRVDIFCKMNYPDIIDTRQSLVHVIFDGKHWRLNKGYPEDMDLPTPSQTDKSYLTKSSEFAGSAPDDMLKLGAVWSTPISAP